MYDRIPTVSSARECALFSKSHTFLVLEELLTQMASHKWLVPSRTVCFEDGIVAQHNGYKHTMRSVQQVEFMYRHGTIKAWLGLRPFYTEKLLGWDLVHRPISLPWNVLVVSLCRDLLLLMVCFVYVPLLISLFLAGPVAWYPMRDGVQVMDAPGCYLQALLSNYKDVLTLLEDSEHVEDVVLTKVVVSVIVILGTGQTELFRQVISPSQIQHVRVVPYKGKKKSWNRRRRIGTTRRMLRDEHGLLIRDCSV
ncbi:CAZyme family GT109 [Aspergillus niger]|nr:CAZyme family GT109 [Aspergillus niger]